MTAYAEGKEQGVADAVNFAKERLGDPEVLQDELQATVPKSEHWGSGNAKIAMFTHLETLFDVKCKQPLKHAFWASVYMFITFMLTLLPLALVLSSIRLWTKGKPDIGMTLFSQAGIIMGMMLCMFITFFLGMYLFTKTGLHKLVHATSSLPAFFKACIVTALWMGVVFSFLFMALAFLAQCTEKPDFDITISTLWFAFQIPLFYLFPLGSTAVVTYGMYIERRQYEAWGHLEIDE